MVTKHTHIDPATFLALPYVQTSLDKHRFVEQLGQLAGCLWNARNSVSLVFCEDHYVELLQQFDGRDYADGRARQTKHLLIRYLGVRQCVRHAYGESGVDSRIVDPLNKSLSLGEGDAIVAWADMLSSNLLIEEEGCAPGYSHPCFTLISSNNLDVLVGDQVRKFSFFSDWDALASHFQIVEPGTLGAIIVNREPKFAWEKSGHGATKYQERIVVRTARSSQVVVRSGTTYQNPQGGIRKSSVSPTDDASEFLYTVVDGANVLRGIYKTNATTEQQSRLALHALRTALERTLETG